MRVDDALRHSGRAARVAHGRSSVLVELRILPVVRVGGGEQVLVVVLDDDHVLDLRLGFELVETGEQRPVDDHRLVARVRRDVREVGRVEAEVERVQDKAAAGNAEVALVVHVVVPGEGRDAVARLEAEVLEGNGELLRPAHRLADRVAVEALVRHPRDDLLLREVRLGAAQQRRQRQLEVHHLSAHLGQTVTPSQSPSNALISTRSRMRSGSRSIAARIFASRPTR